MPRASRADAATGIALISAGVSAGVRRERDRLVDIVLRGSGPEAQDPGALLDQPIWSPATGSDVPLAQLVDGFDVVARDTLVGRRDGEPMVTVRANVVDGVTPPTVFGEIRPAIEAIALPRGCTLEWGGAFESAGGARASLGRQRPPSFGTMLLITVLPLGQLRQTVAIWTIVPMAVNGVALGLPGRGCTFPSRRPWGSCRPRGRSSRTPSCR
jgi:multidrug efflux pump subunit AcrB